MFENGDEEPIACDEQLELFAAFELEPCAARCRHGVRWSEPCEECDDQVFYEQAPPF